jgi:hypothetical protein
MFLIDLFQAITEAGEAKPIPITVTGVPAAKPVEAAKK